jgi:signal transduction histidine kinase
MLQSLDLRSIFLLSAIVCLAGSLLLARRSGPQPDPDCGAAWPAWLLSTIVQGSAFLGHAARGDLAPAFVFSVVNATQILALGLLWVGARRLAGHRLPLWMAALPSALWLAACLVPGFINWLPVRISLFFLMTFGLLIATIMALVRLHQREGLRTALNLALMLGLVAAAGVGICVEAILFQRPLAAGWGIVGTFAGLIVALFGVTLPFLLLAIRRERERAKLDARRAKALAAGRAEVERLHEGLPVVIFLREVQPDGTSRLRYRGGDLERVMGWPAERFGTANGPHAMLIPDGWTLEGHLRTALRDGMAREEWRLRQPDSSLRHILSETRVLGTAPSGAVEVVGYARDVTQERLADARAMAALRLASLGEMGAGLAHEVKQPLQALSLAAELALLALGPEVPEGVRCRLDTVLSEAARAADIIEHVRRFARGAPDDARPVPVALAEPVDGALRLLRLVLEEARVELELALGDAPLRVQGVSVVLEQVLVSLLLNTRDALAVLPAGAPRRLRIAAEAVADHQVVLTVADTGGGIDAAVLPRLFEPFVTTKGPDRGRGLSLASAHGLVRSLGGTLCGANAEQGAIFTLTLPAATEENGPLRATT